MADSIRDELTKAFAASDTNTENAATETPVTDDTPTQGTDDAAHTPIEDSGSADAGSTASTTGEVPPSTEGTAPAAAPSVEAPAPASWSTEERAAWATVPAKAREAIARREGEMNRALQTSAVARRRVEALEQMAKPYEPLLRSYGITVEQAMPGLLATRAALEVGTPQQKADLVANLCADFGIEVELLDGSLSKRYANGTPTPRVAPQMPDLSNNPQLAPLFALAGQFQQAQTERAQQAVSTVANDPHYQAVRFTMADLIEQAAAQGRKLDLPVALRLAKEMHGFTSQAPASTGNAVSDAARTLAAARNAAGSVSGAPKPTPPRKPGEGTLRDEILANMAAKKRA